MKFLAHLFMLFAIASGVATPMFFGHALETHQGRFFAMAGCTLLISVICVTITTRVGRRALPAEDAHGSHSH
jgi:hypothetical protein